MGEKIKILASGNLNGNDIEIELNEPVVSFRDKQIHIQSSKARYELEYKDFLRMAFGLCFSAEQLKRVKKIKDDDDF